MKTVTNVNVRVLVSLIASLASLGAAYGQSPTGAAQAPTNPKAERDAGAVSILSRSLSSNQPIADFRASGTIVYFAGDGETSADFSAKGRGIDQFYLDASLPNGSRTLVVDRGKASLTEPTGQTATLPYHSAINAVIPLVPHMWVSSAVSTVSTTIVSLPNASEPSGASTPQPNAVAIQPKLFDEADPRIQALSRKVVLLDPGTSQILKIRDSSYPIETMGRSVPRTFEFSAYQEMNGQLVPTVITETIGGAKIWEMHIASVVCNVGLSDSDFLLTAK